MKRQKLIPVILGAIVILILAVLVVIPAGHPDVANSKNIDQLPKIYPDYCGVVIPPNIAPLNFMINEKAEKYFVKISAGKGTPIEISSTDSKIIIPEDDWKELLASNKGQKFQINIYIEDANGSWSKFKTIDNMIAAEAIDNHLAYRLIHPGHNFWVEMGLYQRDLENYDEDPIIVNELTESNCMNCHSFCANNPDQMQIHLRAGKTSGTLYYRNGKVIKANTKTSFNKAGSYPSWHPNGKMVAYSVNNLLQFFHATGESRDVLDRGSDLIVYLIDENTVTSCDKISDPERMETFPAWSPDGNYLYFSSAPKLENFTGIKDGEEDLLYEQIRYDLMRIRYYPETKTWGELETVLAASKLGMSITEIRPSPDGKFLLFTASDYGNFPIYRKSSDVYILDLTTGEYFRPDANSDQTDSFHSWSSNSRWFVFSSKRGDGILARPYFCYFDVNGKTYKPFVMPQKDPAFYTSFLKTFNLPELIKGRINVEMKDLLTAAYDSINVFKAKLDPNLKTRKTASSPETMWRQGKK